MTTVSLKDIARDLEVSVSLVSKVLNGRLGTTGVRQPLQEKIRKRAAELGFQPNSSARALKQGRHDTIGVFIHRAGMTGSGIIEDLLDGLSGAALLNRQRLMLSFFTNAGEFASVSSLAHSGAIDGLIVAGVFHPELKNRLMAIRNNGMPMVTVYNAPLHRSLPNVGIDQVAVSQLATQHLIDRGCRRIVHIQNMQERYEGYRAALAGNNLPHRPEWVFKASLQEAYSHTTGEQAVQAFIRNKVAFDGLVAQSDQEAAGAINALFAAGLRVPDDVRVIGIDNAPYCEFSRVPISSVSQDFKRQGALAIDAILASIAGRPVVPVTVDPILVARASTG